MRLWRCPYGDRSGSGNSLASAQSVGQRVDPIDSAEFGASADPDAAGAFFELTQRALGRIAPHPRYGCAAVVADRLPATDKRKPDQRPATDERQTRLATSD